MGYQKNGKGLITTVLGVGVALASLMQRGFSRIDTELTEIRNDVADLRERMARLEGLFEGHVNEDCNE